MQWLLAFFKITMASWLSAKAWLRVWVHDCLVGWIFSLISFSFSFLLSLLVLIHLPAWCISLFSFCFFRFWFFEKKSCFISCFRKHFFSFRFYTFLVFECLHNVASHVGVKVYCVSCTTISSSKCFTSVWVLRNFVHVKTKCVNLCCNYFSALFFFLF